jgi:hypothetical protein
MVGVLVHAILEICVAPETSGGRTDSQGRMDQTWMDHGG